MEALRSQPQSCPRSVQISLKGRILLHDKFTGICAVAAHMENVLKLTCTAVSCWISVNLVKDTETFGRISDTVVAHFEIHDDWGDCVVLTHSNDETDWFTKWG